MKERIKDLNGEEIIENCKSIIVDLQRGTFKEEKNNEIVFTREDFEYSITKNMKHIEIKTNELKDSTRMFNEFLNFFELLFLFYGYFPKISKISVMNENDEIVFINKEKYLTYKYVSSKLNKKTYNKLIDINKLNNLPYIINNWNELKNKLGLCISGLFMAQMDDLKYIDVINVVLLQSIDGYITNHIFSDLKKYDEEYVTITKNGNTKIKKIKTCTNDDKNEINFKRKLELFIKDFKDEVLKQEQKKEDKSQIFNTMEDFLKKCKNSRNRLAHMNAENKKTYFEGIENIYAFYKLLLIFRLNLICDLKLKDNIIKQNIDLNVY